MWLIPKCPIAPIDGGVVLTPKGPWFVTVSFDEVNIVEEVKGEEYVIEKNDLKKCGKDCTKDVGIISYQFFVRLASFVLQVCGSG